jgi:hypothetical protein
LIGHIPALDRNIEIEIIGGREVVEKSNKKEKTWKKTQ